MRKQIIFTSAVLALQLVALSCVREQNPDGQVQVAYPEIRISAGFGQTKSILDKAEHLEGSSAIQLYDYKSTDEEGGLTVHIGKSVSYGASANTHWSLGESYSWFDKINDKAVARDHNFIAWLTTDKDGLTATNLFGTGGITYSDPGDNAVKTISVPETAITLESAQFDFCYSDLLQRKKAKADYSTVGLQMRHLLTCFGIKASNYTSEAVNITSVKLYGLANIKSGSVAYDMENGTTTPTVTPAATSTSWPETDKLELLKTGTTITVPAENKANTPAEGVVNNIITRGDKSTDNPEFFLMWPQTNGELQNAKIDVTYNTGGTPNTVTIPLAPINGGWDAGIRQELELSFTEKKMLLTITPKDWYYYQPSIDYDAEVVVNSGGELTFDESTCVVDKTNKCVYFKNGNPITIHFRIEAPEAGTWLISKEGDMDAFEIDNADESQFGDGEDYNYGQISAGKTATVTIYPTVEDPDKDYQITLSFAVRTPNGQVISVNNKIQGSDDRADFYKIILQAS